MTGLFKEMNITSVAEGVETAAERDAVLESGCDFIQGYLFSKPGREFPTVAW
jgi:EAL domain-containing protein (putative c-di-GMP-specific phosphodiesterase class I)